jgi:hypothetical protein
MEILTEIYNTFRSVFTFLTDSSIFNKITVGFLMVGIALIWTGDITFLVMGLIFFIIGALLPMARKCFNHHQEIYDSNMKTIEIILSYPNFEGDISHILSNLSRFHFQKDRMENYYTLLSNISFSDKAIEESIQNLGDKLEKFDNRLDTLMHDIYNGSVIIPHEIRTNAIQAEVENTCLLLLELYQKLNTEITAYKNKELIWIFKQAR